MLCFCLATAPNTIKSEAGIGQQQNLSLSKRLGT